MDPFSDQKGVPVEFYSYHNGAFPAGHLAGADTAGRRPGDRVLSGGFGEGTISASNTHSIRNPPVGTKPGFLSPASGDV
jgi:hypothetical protein